MFHFKLLELEAELIAKAEAARAIEMTAECVYLLQLVESEIGVKLASRVPKDWRGWLTYRRNKDALLVCRGRAISGGIFGNPKAGFEVAGDSSISDYERGFDVTPPQDSDHLMINFGEGDTTRVFLWYGEGIAAYKLVFESPVDPSPEPALLEAVVEACGWVLKRPKHTTLSQYLKQQEA